MRNLLFIRIILIFFILFGIALFACNKDKGPVGTISLTGISRKGLAFEGIPVCFYAISSGATSFSWNFGDGNTSVDDSPCHTYTNTGEYTVSVTMNNDTVYTLRTTFDVLLPPTITNLLDGVKNWRHTSIVNSTSGFSDTSSSSDTLFAIHYIDPVTICLGADTLGYSSRYFKSNTDSVLVYNKVATISGIQETVSTLSFVHGVTDSIQYSVEIREFEGGEIIDEYFTP